MPMAVIAVTKETRGGETRVAATPETVKKLAAAGFSVVVQAGAGIAASYPDADYEAAGAKLAKTAKEALKDADVLFKVRAPEAAEIAALKPGAIVAAALNPHQDKDTLNALAKAGVSALAMEFIPRITRAQVMDMLSSQANLAGYRAVIEAAEAYGKALPMMMTAAGTIAAAKVFIMGVGVAGLQAIATARRLGAVVTATDVRPATKEQVESLGAKFLAVEDEEFKNAQTAGGYAKEMSKEYQAKQAELVSSHIAKQDIVITTALIPGRPAPKLVSRRPGGLDEAGLGDRRPGHRGRRQRESAASWARRSVTANGVKILGIPNLPGRIATDASALYARNLFALSSLFLNKEGAFAPDFEDEILKAALVTQGGAVVHPSLQG
jgi:NAD(P) transhydrogenase subunit alpha